MRASLLSLASLATSAWGYDQVLGFNNKVVTETRSLDEIHKAALKEGGVVTLWHGGDAVNQQAGLKKAFEKRFPGMHLNITVDLSKYHDARLDQQLAAGGKAVYVDSVILQTLHDYPRWAQEGALLNYAPKGFDQIEAAYKDTTASWYGVYIFYWTFGWNAKKLPGIKAPVDYPDFLRPEFKDKLVLTYPNDDDAVLYAFQLIMQQYGVSWFEKLLKQNPRWVRGTATPASIARASNYTEAAFFATGGAFQNSEPMHYGQPKNGKYVTWAQMAGIPKDAPHPEGAKLLHNFILSPEFQKSVGTWSVRRDIPTPEGYPDLANETTTNPTEFTRWMSDRATVERLRFWFEAQIGSAQGVDPIHDPINMQ
ncbi:hypothetical protein FPSE_00282 [Fusarium pseudograminearum CS3096]|uniref:ABC-type Fe3+ transport system n=1 Tax=Fusarium pseudograminearum (strain CS3096) TaxID=1028729 RepID=K3VUL4_FUSPC|nr:hypothetical protein FPSE_00282 [Fusarium pseudograminearum CS3096]EKJ79597.1 hypothetical protein FPSE_00282 [Fusarium pseudograminearum CS3096]KAF0635662.1 hypothetical protein FPSE5266_00282 [Fusarium pseudograminearum]